MFTHSVDSLYSEVPGAAIYPAEREWLRRTAAELTHAFFPRRLTVVNIGVMWGASMHCLRAGASNARLIGVDININRDNNHTIWKPELLQAEFIEADSTTYTKFTAPIHFLFIDGCHHEHTVAADIKTWSPHVVLNGIMAFHDYSPNATDFAFHPDTIGVRRAVDKWSAGADDWEYVDSCLSIIAFKRISRNVSIPLFSQAEVQWSLQTPQAIPA